MICFNNLNEQKCFESSVLHRYLLIQIFCGRVVKTFVQFRYAIKNLAVAGEMCASWKAVKAMNSKFSNN